LRHTKFPSKSVPLESTWGNLHSKVKEAKTGGEKGRNLAELGKKGENEVEHEGKTTYMGKKEKISSERQVEKKKEGGGQVQR